MSAFFISHFGMIKYVKGWLADAFPQHNGTILLTSYVIIKLNLNEKARLQKRCMLSKHCCRLLPKIVELYRVIISLTYIIFSTPFIKINKYLKKFRYQRRTKDFSFSYKNARVRVPVRLVSKIIDIFIIVSAPRH